jgi:hypothetical protein
MTILLDKSNLYSTFSVSSFDELKSSIDSIAPSMTEYYLNDLSSFNASDLHLNKSNIEQSLYLDSYSLYLDYSENVYLEITKQEEVYETATLW